MNTYLKQKYGYTLLEILIVIGIIAILVGMGTISYSTAQKKARDTKRKADVRSIQSGMEQYFSICGNAYPTPGNSIICVSPSIAVMPNVPRDPFTTPYPSGAPFSTSAYTICSGTLETEAAPFCLSNQQ